MRWGMRWGTYQWAAVGSGFALILSTGRASQVQEDSTVSGMYLLVS